MFRVCQVCPLQGLYQCKCGASYLCRYCMYDHVLQCRAGLYGIALHAGGLPSPVEKDPLHRWASSLSLAGRPMHEVGIIWKQAVLVSNTRSGEVSRLPVHNHVGSLVEGANLDVL